MAHQSASRRVVGLGVAGLAALTAFPVLVWSAPAAADLRVCNETQSRVGVAVGYRDGEEMTTEGWWNLPASACVNLINGALASRQYYIYAIDYDLGGDWHGTSFMCTSSTMFTIRGSEDCVARGFDRTGFFEVDVGDDSSHTIQLNP